jgi:hypothetical protein
MLKAIRTLFAIGDLYKCLVYLEFSASDSINSFNKRKETPP